MLACDHMGNDLKKGPKRTEEHIFRRDVGESY